MLKKMKANLPLLVFLVVFGGTLVWSAIDCCPANSMGQSYHTCLAPPESQCGSGNWCLKCWCDFWVEYTVNSGCPSPGTYHALNNTTARAWIDAHETGTCWAYSINSRHTVNTPIVYQNNSCGWNLNYCQDADCLGRCTSDSPLN